MEVVNWTKSWKLVLISWVEIAQARICHNQAEIWCEIHLYFSSNDNVFVFVTLKRNLVWNINCTRLPVSELITSRNLSLFWNCALSTSHCSAIPAPTVNWYFLMQAEWKLTWMSNMRQCKETFHPNVRANNVQFSHTLYLLATCSQCIWVFFLQNKGALLSEIWKHVNKGGVMISHLREIPWQSRVLCKTEEKVPQK